MRLSVFGSTLVPMTRTAARDLGLRRVRSLTKGAAVGAVALTGIGASLAAAHRPGHTTVRTASRRSVVNPAKTAAPSDGTRTGDAAQGDDENGTGADLTPATEAPQQPLSPPPTAPSASSGSSSLGGATGSGGSNSSSSGSSNGGSAFSGGGQSFGPSSGFGGGGGGSVVSGAS